MVITALILDQVEFLAGLKRSLHSLTLDNNPIAALPGYVEAVQDSLPKLDFLDDLSYETPLEERPSYTRGQELNAGIDHVLDERSIVAESLKLSRIGRILTILTPI
jgi:hypothetical protein